MSEEIYSKILDLIENGIGDLERLDHIMNTIQKGETLYESDKKYLDSLIFKYFDNDLH